jgi:hypothetical protein
MNCMQAPLLQYFFMPWQWLFSLDAWSMLPLILHMRHNDMVHAAIEAL